jgi:hypothetical protein
VFEVGFGAQGAFTARLQGLLVPLTTRLAGNCHWNRDTRQAVSEAGFHIYQECRLIGGLVPMFLLQATKTLVSTNGKEEPEKA